MTYTLLAVSSITYAMKGKRLLNGMGYYCEIEKTPKGLSSGCGHSLRVRDDPQVRRNGIDTRDRMTVNR